MSVLFSNVENQKVDFGGVSALRGLASKTVSFWVYVSSYVGSACGIVYPLLGDLSTATNESFFVRWSNADNKWRVVGNWSGNVPVWTFAKVTAGAWTHVAISYNHTSASNKPVVYYNGVSQTVTTSTAPSGTVASGTTNNTQLGGHNGEDNTSLDKHSLNGYLADFRAYNSILSASQVAALYAAGAFASNFDTNLVFHAPLTNATGLSGSAFDGFTLTSSQKLIDRIGCAQGTPSGSPLGSDTNP